MNDLAELYQEIILDHGKRPRNFREIEDADRSAEGFNPLCGDKVRFFVKLHDGTIEDVSFTGAGCAICTATASLLTQHLKGRTVGDAGAAFDLFMQLLTGPEADPDPALAKLAALAGVRRYPMRVKCATLPWHTIKAALEQADSVVTTE